MNRARKAGKFVYIGKNGMRIKKVIVALAVGALAFTLSAGASYAAFGDGFGIAPINSHPAATDPVPALPGQGFAFWAGACHRSDAPAPPPGAGDPPTPIAGGIGGISPRILVPALYFDPIFGLNRSVPGLVPAPATPEHCIDTGGAPAPYKTAATLWRTSPDCPSPCPAPPTVTTPSPCGTFAPCWRLAAASRAGEHADGSTTFAFRRGANNQVDGAVDNIYVDLPPGFVGDPNAVPECTGEQFAAFPLACPPETQVGVIRLQVEGVGLGTEGGNLISSDDKVFPVYNLEPRRGNVAELGFGHVGDGGLVTVRLVGKPRTNDDFGVTAFVGQIPAALAAVSQTITIWGVPWAAHNDVWRPKLGHFDDSACRVQLGLPAHLSAGSGMQFIPEGGLTPACQAHYSPNWGDTPARRTIKPFFSNETDCNPSPTVRLAIDSYQHNGAVTPEGYPDIPPYPAPAPDDDVSETPTWKIYSSASPQVTDCASLDFGPDFDFAATTSDADGASGLVVDLAIPQKESPRDPLGAPLAAPAPGATQGTIDDYVADATDYWKSDAGRAVAHLRDTVVQLPPGMPVNPSSAAGLQACSDAQIGVRGSEAGRLLFNDGDPFDGQTADGVECPQEAVIGTVEVETPLLDEHLTGQIVLGTPETTNPQGENGKKMFRLFLVVRNAERGLLAKIYGSSVADPGTGQQTATFEQNPELPFDDLRVEFKGGSRGLLAMPQRCGSHEWTSTLTPWSAEGGGLPVDDSGSFPVSTRCAFGFGPGLSAGMSGNQGGKHGVLSFDFTRPEGDDWVRGLTAELPTGLLAKVKGVRLCTDAEASQGACPVESRIGSVDGAAGSGTPFVLERKGDIYLTEGYKGGPYGLMVRVPVEAGPFRGDKALSPIVVRQKIEVDPATAQVRAISDPLPLIHHGIPLRVREIAVKVDRPGFMLNPTDCSPKSIRTTLTSAQGQLASPSSFFQAAGCGELAFKPKLSLRLTGKRQITTGKHPGIRAVVTQTPGQAGIQRAEVRLPKSLALDPNNAQALCEFADGTKPDLENHCPKASIVGRARAVSPLLERPLVGNVYFVKNVRRSSSGNLIRTLPMIIVALRGEVAINLRGESEVKRKKLVSTFAQVPDAPVERFNLNIAGGRNGIIAVTRTRKAKINICRSKRQVAESDMDAQNGRRHDADVVMRKPCPKKKAAKTGKAGRQDKRTGGRG